MDDFNHLCPVCRIKGNTTFLYLRQINLTTAVYLCKDIRCTYPQGYSWIYVDKNLFNDDQSDSDSSDTDSVNDDIERIENATKKYYELKPSKTRNHNNEPKFNSSSSVDDDIKRMQNAIKENYELKPTNTRNYNIGVLKPDEQKSNDSVVDDIERMQNAIKENYELKPTKTGNHNIIGVSKPNEQKFDETKHQENNYVGLSTKTDDPITNIVEKSVDKDNPINDEFNYNLCDIQSELSIIDNDSDEDMGSEIIVASPCENETLLITATEVENIIIDDPEGLFETLDLPCSKNTIDTQPKILASGALDSEIVDFSLSKAVTIDIKYPSDKNDNPNNIKLDIQLTGQKQDNISNKEDIYDLELEKTNNLFNVPEKETIRLHNFKKIDEDEVKNIQEPVINIENTTREDTYYAGIEKKIEKNIKKKNKSPGRSKSKTVSDHLKLPSVGDIDTDFSLRIKKADFENVFKSKLKICTTKKQEQQEYCFPKSIVQEALETTKEDETKIKLKRDKSLVNVLFNEPKRKKDYTKNDSPTFFGGFKFSSKTIKSATSSPKKKTEEPIIEEHIKEKLVESNCSIELNNTNSVQKQLTAVENNANNVSGESASNNSNFGDEALNEFFDNIDEHKQVNSPNSDVNITEFEELLISLCH